MPASRHGEWVSCLLLRSARILSWSALCYSQPDMYGTILVQNPSINGLRIKKERERERERELTLSLFAEFGMQPGRQTR